MRRCLYGCLVAEPIIDSLADVRRLCGVGKGSEEGVSEGLQRG